MIEEVKKYQAKTDSLLNNAQFMLENGMLDGAVNRAYYAMFTAIRAALFPHGIFTKSHTGAHTKFRELYIKNALLPVELSKMLSTVFEWRQEVDYDFEILEDQDVAKKAIEFGQFFCSAVFEILEKNK